MRKSQLERLAVSAVLCFVLFLGVRLTQPEVGGRQQGEAKISFLDVGQGDAILAESKNGRFVLIDGGPDKSVLTSLGEQLPVGTKEIDTIILTHPHADHLVGLNYVLERYRVNNVYLTGVLHSTPEYADFIAKFEPMGLHAERLYRGKKVEVDGLMMEALWPETDLAGQSVKDLNDSSIAMLLKSDETKLLLLGDLSTEKQLYFASSLGRVDLLKVSHHGSKDGTSLDVIGLLKPNYSVISVGKDNTFGHPALSVLNILSASKIYRTDINGTVTFVLTKNSVIPL